MSSLNYPLNPTEVSSPVNSFCRRPQAGNVIAGKRSKLGQPITLLYQKLKGVAMKKLIFAVFFLCFIPFSSLKAKPGKGIEISNILPDIFNQKTQTVILDMPIPDPSLLIGSLINIKDLKIFMLGSDNCLTKDAKPVSRLINEKPVYNHIISDSLVSNVDFLSFLKVNASESNKVELCVNRIYLVDIEQKYLDELKIKKNPRLKRVNPEDWGVIVGYSDYLISANIYSSKGSGGDLNAYSVSIGGKLYKKELVTEAKHKIEAIWAPIPFIEKIINDRVQGRVINTSLKSYPLIDSLKYNITATEMLNHAIKNGKIIPKNKSD
jgi:hypothetical protein